MNANRNDPIRALYRSRPRSRFLRFSLFLFGAFAAYAWVAGEIGLGELFRGRRAANLQRFLEQDAYPYALRGSDFSWSGLWEWARSVGADHANEAIAATIGISVLAIVLASVAAALSLPLATRSLMTRDPYLQQPGAKHAARGSQASADLGWRLCSKSVRVIFVLLRATPEYILAFLALTIFGQSAWPAVLALAIHNAGILGRLGAEAVENLDRAPLRSMRMLGGGRRQVLLFAIFPIALPRFLLLFFYRVESCVREATVLGMLGVLSLGYWIQDARARQRYDEMLLWIAAGAVLVLLTDLSSQLARAWVRRAR